MHAILLILSSAVLAAAAPISPSCFQNTPKMPSARVGLGQAKHPSDPQYGENVASNESLTTERPAIARAPTPQFNATDRLHRVPRPRVVPSIYIESHPDSVLPRADGSVMLSSDNPDDVLLGPFNSRLRLHSNGVLTITDTDGIELGRFEGAMGACSIDGLLCVLRLEKGVMVIGSQFKGQIIEPAYRGGSRAEKLVVMPSGDIWLVDNTGLLRANIPLDIPTEMYQDAFNKYLAGLALP